ncbi:MAG: hypothetical protein ACFFAN_03455 [Promethearchaeota archaeon]
MKNYLDKTISTQKTLKFYIKNKVIKEAERLRGKFAPFSELVDNIPKTLAIKEIYNLKEHKYLFLIIVKNYSRQLKLRYFLAIVLASQSSDLLVEFAKKFANKKNLKLIQYSIFPENFRISLLSLKEINKFDDYSSLIELLTDFRKKFRNKLLKIKYLLENE